MQAEVLEDLMSEHPVVGVILEHRHIQKLVQGFISTLNLHLGHTAPPPVALGSQVRLVMDTVVAKICRHHIKCTINVQF